MISEYMICIYELKEPPDENPLTDTVLGFTNPYKHGNRACSDTFLNEFILFINF